MKNIKRTIELKAPAQRAYDFLAQPANLPSVWPNMLSVSNVAASSKGAFDFDWVYKMAGIHFKGHSKIEEAQPGKSLIVHSEGAIASTFRWKFEGQNGATTRLVLDVEYEIPTPVIGKMAEALVAKLNERDADALLANLKDVLESATVPAAAGARPH